MGDFSTPSQDYNQIVISPASPESLGPDLVLSGANANATGAWPTANRAIFVPFQVHTPITVVKIGVYNGTTASGNLDAGIYDEPGNRLVSMGSTAQAGTSAIQSLDITDTTLAPGGYYMALAMDGTTGTAFRWGTAIALNSAMGVLSQASAFALPATATFAAAADAYIPFFYLTARTLI